MKNDLTDLLKTWNPAVSEPVAFGRGVWGRIEGGGADKSFAGMWWKEILLSLARPKMAVAILAGAILAGAWIGLSTANPDGRQAYLRSVNPYAHGSMVSDS